MFDLIVENGKAVFTRLNLLIWIALSLILSFAGPFGTYEGFDWGERLIYWSLVVVISSIMGILIFRHSPSLVPGRNPFLADLLSIAAMTVLFTPIVMGLTRALLLSPGEAGPTLLDFVIYVVAVTTSVALFRRLMPGAEARYAPPEATPDRDQEPDPPRLLRRLPEDFEGEILRLSSRDHFVDIITSAGTFTVRMRLSDAIAEMDTVPGLCTHRSHWVALSAARAVERQNGRTVLALGNGDTVPVSRKYRPDLTAAGLG
jgi:hypothetical protein